MDAKTVKASKHSVCWAWSLLNDCEMLYVAILRMKRPQTLKLSLQTSNNVTIDAAKLLISMVKRSEFFFSSRKKSPLPMTLGHEPWSTKP